VIYSWVEFEVTTFFSSSDILYYFTSSYYILVFYRGLTSRQGKARIGQDRIGNYIPAETGWGTKRDRKRDGGMGWIVYLYIVE
jgi:hypothetical protein